MDTFPAFIKKTSLRVVMTKFEAREGNREAEGEGTSFCPHHSSFPPTHPGGKAEDGHSHL